jgi:hypothetical protein
VCWEVRLEIGYRGYIYSMTDGLSKTTFQCFSSLQFSLKGDLLGQDPHTNLFNPWNLNLRIMRFSAAPCFGQARKKLFDEVK